MFGAPGAGKGTYASRLKEKLGVETIATGDIFRELMKENSELGKKVKSYVEKGLIGSRRSCHRSAKTAFKQNSKGQRLHFDGYPRTIEQAKMLETITPN